MKKTFLMIVILSGIYSLSQAQTNAIIHPPVDIDTANVKVYLDQALNAPVYELHVGNKKYIRQTIIPAVPGNQRFKNTQQAKKVGQLAVQRMNQGLFPPPITIADLTALGINFILTP